MINYRLDKYTPNGFKFVFDDNRYTIIDLVKNYESYREPCGRTCDSKWHYVVINVDKIYEKYHKNKLKVGDIVYLEKINNYPNFSSKGVDFRKATQRNLTNTLIILILIMLRFIMQSKIYLKEI